MVKGIESGSDDCAIPHDLCARESRMGKCYSLEVIAVAILCILVAFVFQRPEIRKLQTASRNDSRTVPYS